MTKLPDDLRAGANATRHFSLRAEDRQGIDVDARTVTLAFSSETRDVERSWGVEILDHAPKSIRLNRLKSGAPLLVNHDTNDHVGVIESVQIGADRVARAVVRFGKSARAGEVFQDVIDGIRPNVSVGYLIHAAVLESEKDGQSVYRITDWEPYEITLASIPADITVGVGRSADKTPTKEPAAMSNPETTAVATATAPAVNVDAVRASGADAERKRTADILAISGAEAYKRFDLADLAGEAIRNGMSVDEFRSKAMDKMTQAPKQTAEIGLTRTEVQKFSFLRAMNFLANPHDAAARNAAGFEIECSRAASQKQGRAAQGIMVPFEVLRRDLTVGTATAGGHTVDTELRSQDFIELLRNAQVISGMGVQYLTGLVGNIAIPRQTGGASHYWVAESGAPSESNQAFDQVTMSPKTVGAMTDISRRLLLQSSLDVEGFVQRDLATVLGLALQSATITGGGAEEPTGILGTGGIGSVAGGTNGLAPTWDHIVDLESAVSVANADVGSLAYLTNAKVRGKLKKTFVDGPGTGERVWQGGNTPLNGYRAAVTNAVPSNLDKGTSNDVCSAIIFGNWSDVIVGMWGGLDLLVDPYTQGSSGTVRIRVLQDVDIAIRHALSFAAMTDALTA